MAVTAGKANPEDRTLGAAPTRRELLFGARGRNVSEACRPLARISAHCLSLTGVACRNCDDACDARAIRFRARIGGHYVPTIVDAACTACGECIAVCPVNAISIAGSAADAAPV